METIRRHAKMQQDAVGVFLIALAFVLLYAIWGAYVLHNSRLAEAQGTAVADSR